MVREIRERDTLQQAVHERTPPLALQVGATAHSFGADDIQHAVMHHEVGRRPTGRNQRDALAAADCIDSHVVVAGVGDVKARAVNGEAVRHGTWRRSGIGLIIDHANRAQCADIDGDDAVDVGVCDPHPGTAGLRHHRRRMYARGRTSRPQHRSGRDVPEHCPCFGVDHRHAVASPVADHESAPAVSHHHAVGIATDMQVAHLAGRQVDSRQAVGQHAGDVRVMGRRVEHHGVRIKMPRLLPIPGILVWILVGWKRLPAQTIAALQAQTVAGATQGQEIVAIATGDQNRASIRRYRHGLKQALPVDAAVTGCRRNLPTPLGNGRPGGHRPGAGMRVERERPVQRRHLTVELEVLCATGSGLEDRQFVAEWNHTYREIGRRHGLAYRRQRASGR